jgi:hypothetical protein
VSFQAKVRAKETFRLPDGSRVMKDGATFFAVLERVVDGKTVRRFETVPPVDLSGAVLESTGEVCFLKAKLARGAEYKKLVRQRKSLAAKVEKLSAELRSMDARIAELERPTCGP